MPDEVNVIGDALAEHPEQAGLENLRQRAARRIGRADARLRVACVLARLEPASAGSMTAVAAPLAEALLAEHPRTLATVDRAAGPCSHVLIPPLSEICRDRDRDATAQSIAAEAVADILGRQDEPELLAAARRGCDARGLARSAARAGAGRARLQPALDTLRKVLDERIGRS